MDIEKGLIAYPVFVESALTKQQELRYLYRSKNISEIAKNFSNSRICRCIRPEMGANRKPEDDK
jgi:hypothetical protein